MRIPKNLKNRAILLYTVYKDRAQSEVYRNPQMHILCNAKSSPNQLFPASSFSEAHIEDFGLDFFGGITD